jgi:uncharacterized protein YdeI (YjbR/CyaY-like superfamily)
VATKKKAAPADTIRSFRNAAQFRRWLGREHARASALLLRFYKKASGVATITYAEALDEALCFGWIDGIKLAHDELSWLQRFTPRRPRSGWSKINTRHAERLIAAGAMRPAGQAAIDAAKADGRWQRAYDSQSTAAPPPEFLVALARNPKAADFYRTLNKSNLYAIAYRLHTAKRPETRHKRQRDIIAMLARGEKLH